MHMETFKTNRIVILSVSLSLFSAVIVVGLQNSWSSRPASKTFEAQISDDSHKHAYTARVNTVNAIDSLDFIQFPSGGNGWGGSHSGVFYKTSDGGNKWERLEAKLDGYVGSMFFTSDSSGWIIFNQYGKNFDKTQYQSSVM